MELNYEIQLEDVLSILVDDFPRLEMPPYDMLEHLQQHAARGHTDADAHKFGMPTSLV